MKASERTPQLDTEGRCIACGIYLSYCEDCDEWWAGSHYCSKDE